MSIGLLISSIIFSTFLTPTEGTICFIKETGNLKYYDNETQDCTDGRLVLKKQPLLVTLAPSVHVPAAHHPVGSVTRPPIPAPGRTLHQRHPRPTTNRSTTTTRKPTTHRIGPLTTESPLVTTYIVTTPPQPTIKHGKCADGNHLIKCLDKFYCSASKDYKCCGFNPYFPEYDTCCAQTPSYAMVHRGKPEKTHACCRKKYTTIYTRGSPDLPCAHASLNDRLWSALPLKKARVTRELCGQLKRTGVVLKVARYNKTSQRYRAIVTTHLDPRSNTTQLQTQKHAGKSDVVSKQRPFLQMDDYSIKKSLARHNYLLSDIRILYNGIVYLKPGINIFALGKKSKLVKKKVKKLRKWCKRLSIVL